MKCKGGDRDRQCRSRICTWSLIHIMAGAIVALQPMLVQIAQAEAQKKFLVPLMMHGPNNQIIAIRETLALARVLGATLVLPDLREHQFTDKAETPMRFVDLFDAALVKSSMDAILLEELPSRLPGGSWNKTLEAVLLMVVPEQMQLTPLVAKAQGLVAPSSDRWFHSPVTSWHGCAEARLSRLKQIMEPYSIIGVQTFHGLLYGSQWLAGPMLLPCSDACCQTYKDSMPLIKKAPSIYAMADRFVAERLGGEPFLATHLRPYPDSCIKLWTLPETPDVMGRMEKACNNAYIWQRFVPSIRYLLAEFGLKKLFVMTHPRVRDVVKRMLQAAGIEPVLMESTDIQPPKSESADAAPRNVSFSMLAMVEEAVCTRAKVFVGTKESSMTGTIVQDRLTQGLPVQHSYAYFRRVGYEKRPVPVDEFYRLTNMSVMGNARWRSRLKKRGVTDV